MKKLIIDKVLHTAIISSLFLIGCMPDSVTKFKEDTPTKESASSSSGGSSSDDSSSTTSSTTISAFDYNFTGGTHQLILTLSTSSTIDSLTVGDTLYVSNTYPTDSGKGQLTIVSIDTDRDEILVDIANVGSDKYVEAGDYIDNCSTGFATCTVGASTADTVSTVSVYLDRTDTSASLTMTPTTDPSSASDWTYSIDPTPDAGISFDTSTGTITAPVVPFLAPELDKEAFTITLTNGNGDTSSDTVTISTVKTNEYTLAFDYSISQRLVLEVDDASGFGFDDNVTDGNNQIYGCTSQLYASCDSAIEYVGLGEIYYIDTSVTPNLVFMTIGTDASEVSFYSGYYIHASDGSFSTQISGEPIRLFNTTDSPTISPTLTPALGTETYSSSPAIGSGLTLTSGTGVITGAGAISTIDTDSGGTFNITAKDTDGSTLATKSLRFRVVDAPSNISYSEPTPVEYLIGDAITQNDASITGLPDAESATVYFSIDTTLPSGLTFSTSDGSISGAPLAYVSGSTYTVSAFHPYSAPTAFDTYAMNITTATSVSSIYMRQTAGDQLILEVDSTSNFTTGENIISEDGAQASIDYVDDENTRLFVSVTSSLAGSNVFKADDNIDDTTTFVTSAAVINKVIHQFDIGDDLNTTGILSDIYDSSGSAVSLATGETLTYSISPTLPSDLSFDTSAGTITASAVGQSIMNETDYTISVTNSIGESQTFDYSMTVTQTPTDLAVASLQYIPVNAVSNDRFFVGMFIQTQDGKNGQIYDLYENSSGQIEGIYAFFFDFVEPEDGIDNEFPFFSAETAKKNWGFVYVSAIDNFIVGGSISNPDGVFATIISIAPETGGAATGSGNLIVEYSNAGDSFLPGESVDNTSTYVAQETLVSSVSDNFSANVILTVDDSSDFPAGGYISTDSGATDPAIGLIVFNDEINEKLYVRTISGQFADGDEIDNDRTYDSDEGDILTINAVNLELTLTNDTDLSVGKNATISSGGTHQASGTFNSDSDTTDTSYFTEIFSGTVENGDDIDNVNPFVAAEQSITEVQQDHFFKTYVGEDVFIRSYARGTVTEYQISPDLPAGLEIAASDGLIFGTPTENKTRTTYTVTARNGADTVTHTFDLEVISHFYITNNTDNTSSYILHKQGQGNETTHCKVTSSQISGSTSLDGINDIVCTMDAGEADLYYKGVTFNVNTSAGLCEYINYRPYSFNRFPIMTTSTTYYTFSGDLSECTASISGDGVDATTFSTSTPIVETSVTGGSINAFGWTTGNVYCRSGNSCDNTSRVLTTPLCIGDHDNSVSDIEGGVDCDTGSYTTYTYTIADDGDGLGNCISVLTTTDTDCSGDRGSCMGGPIRDEIGDSISVSSNTVSAFSGLDRDYTIADGTAVYSDYLTSSNVYWANYAFLEGIAQDSSNYLINADNWSSAPSFNTGATGAAYRISPLEGLNTNKFYTYECLDSSYNTKARIRIVVRDWDRDFAPNESSYNTDVLDNSSEKADDTSNECFGSSCDIQQDWDSLPSVAVSSTPATTVDTTSGSATVTSDTGAGGDFLTSLYPGYTVRIDGYTYSVESVETDNSFTLSQSAQSTTNGATITVLNGRTLESVPSLDPVYEATQTVSVVNGSTAVQTTGGAGGAFTTELGSGTLINIAGYSYIIDSVTDDNNIVLESPIQSATNDPETLKIYMGSSTSVSFTASDSVDLTKDSNVINSDGGAASFTTELTIGTIVSINGMDFVVTSVNSDNQFEVSVPAPQDVNAGTMTIYKAIPFPLNR